MERNRSSTTMRDERWEMFRLPAQADHWLRADYIRRLQNPLTHPDFLLTHSVQNKMQNSGNPEGINDGLKILKTMVPVRRKAGI